MTDNVSSLTEDQQSLKDMLRKFCDEELAPHAQKIDATNNFDDIREFWLKLGEMGLLGNLVVIYMIHAAYLLPKTYTFKTKTKLKKTL